MEEKISLLAGWFDDTQEQDLVNESYGIEEQGRRGEGKGREGGICWADKQDLMAGQQCTEFTYGIFLISAHRGSKPSKANKRSNQVHRHHHLRLLPSTFSFPSTASFVYMSHYAIRHVSFPSIYLSIYLCVVHSQPANPPIPPLSLHISSCPNPVLVPPPPADNLHIFIPDTKSPDPIVSNTNTLYFVV